MKNAIRMMNEMNRIQALKVTRLKVKHKRCRTEHLEQIREKQNKVIFTSKIAKNLTNGFNTEMLKLLAILKNDFPHSVMMM